MARADGDVAFNNDGADISQRMQNNMAKFGRERALKIFADWTDLIAEGEIAKEMPHRLKGADRNSVHTVRDWGAGHFMHDQISGFHRDPTVNAGVPYFGLGMLAGNLEILDPTTLKTQTVPIQGLHGSAHDEDARLHADEMDEKGSV